MSSPDWRQTADPGSVTHEAQGDIELAIRLADAYRHRSPSVDELMHKHGMSLATAYRWRDRFKRARYG